MKKIFFILIIALTVYPLFAVDLDDFSLKDFNWGVIDTEGNETIVPQNYFAYIPVGETFNYVDLKSEDFGFADRRGRILSPLKFEEPVVLINGYGFFKKGKKYGVCDEKANIILPAEYDIIDTEETLKFLDKGLFLLWKGSQYYIFDNMGKSLLNFAIRDIKLYDDVIIVSDQNYKYSLRDIKGNKIVNYDFNYISPFKDGVAITRIGNYNSLIDKTGKEKIKGTNEYFFTKILGKGKVLVDVQDNSFGWLSHKQAIYKNGKLETGLYEKSVILVHEGITRYSPVWEYELTDGKSNYCFDENFNLLYEIKDDTHIEKVYKNCVINDKITAFSGEKNGEVIKFNTKEEYEKALNEDHDLDFGSCFYYMGMCDRHGKQLMPCEYNSISQIEDNLYLVKINANSQGVFDFKGKEIIPCDYKEIVYKNGLILAKNDEETKVFDKNGKLLLDLTEKYADVSLVGNNILVRQNEDNKYFIIDAKGNKLSKPYDAILDYMQVADKKDIPFGAKVSDYLVCMNKKE